jgi:hypothetical protein
MVLMWTVTIVYIHIGFIMDLDLNEPYVQNVDLVEANPQKVGIASSEFNPSSNP